MVFTPRKDEVALMMEAIRDEESLEGVAKKAVKAGFSIVQGRDLYGIYTSRHTIYGPFESEKAAYDALARHRIPDLKINEDIKGILKAGGIPTLNGEATVFRLIGPLAHSQRVIDVEESNRLKVEGLCKTCEHSVHAHDLAGHVGCSVKGCVCNVLKKP